MAPRQTARRLLVAAPVLALALAVTACTPPNEQPADPDAPYTLPTYTGEAEAEEATPDAEGDPSDGSPEGAPGEATTPAEPTDESAVPGEGQVDPAMGEGQADPAAPVQPAP